MFGGMGNMGNMQGMMKKVQKLQNDMKKMQEELKKKTVEVSAGGGAETEARQRLGFRAARLAWRSGLAF